MDALDAQITHHVHGVRAPDDLLWPAFLSMWKRIGNDCGMDYLCLAGLGVSIGDAIPRPHKWDEPTDEFRAEARAYFGRIGVP